MMAVNLENKPETTEGKSNLKQLYLPVSKYSRHLFINAIRNFKIFNLNFLLDFRFLECDAAEWGRNIPSFPMKPKLPHVVSPKF
jgi:hypothetical protein